MNEGPYTFLTADALRMRARESGRLIKIAVIVATGINADGLHAFLGVATSTAESGVDWSNFFRELVARGLSGVALVASDAHTGLANANLPRASSQHSRSHHTVILMIN